MQIPKTYLEEIEQLKDEYHTISSYLLSEMKKDKRTLSLKQIYSVIEKLFYDDLVKNYDPQDSKEIIKSISKFLFCEDIFYSKRSPLRKNGDPQLSHLISVLKTFMRYYSEFNKNLIFIVLSHDFGEDHGEIHYKEYKKNLLESKEIVLFDNSELNEILNWQRVINMVTLNNALKHRLYYLGFKEDDALDVIRNVKYLTRYPGDHYLDYLVKLIFFDADEEIGDEFFRKIYLISIQDNANMLSEDKLALSFIKISDKIHNTLTLRDKNHHLFNLNHAMRDLVKNLYIFHVYKLFIQQFTIKFSSSLPKDKRNEITGTNKIVKSVSDLDKMFRLDTFFYNNYLYMSKNYYDNPDKQKRIKMAERLYTLSKLIMILGTISFSEINEIMNDFKNKMSVEELKEIKSLKNSLDYYVKSSRYKKITPVTETNPFDGTINSVLLLTQERRLRNPNQNFDKESKIKLYKTFMVLSRLFEDYVSKNSFFIRGFENIDGRITLSERKLIEFSKVVNHYESLLYNKYKQL